MDIKNIKKEFPIFKQKINVKPLVYLDSANSSQKPKVVINKISNFYETEFSNVGRSVHTLAVKATTIKNGIIRIRLWSLLIKIFSIAGSSK